MNAYVVKVDRNSAYTQDKYMELPIMSCLVIAENLEDAIDKFKNYDEFKGVDLKMEDGKKPKYKIDSILNCVHDYIVT